MGHLGFFGRFAILLTVSVSANAFHYDKWENEIDFGGAFISGNSPATTVSGKFISDLDNDYTKQPWGYTLILNANRASARGIETARQASLSVETQYLFLPKYYMYANGRAGYNAFETYDRRIRDSVGLGYVIIKNDIYKWTVEAGPGGVHQRVAGTREWQNQLIGRGETDFLWHLNDKTDVSQTIGVESGKYNTLIISGTSLKTNLMSALALKLTIEVSHYTVIPPGSTNTKKTDTASTVSLAYKF